MKISGEQNAITRMRELKKHYHGLSSKDLISLKAAYEANEEDNKQLSIVVLMVGAVFTLLNLAITSLSKVPTLVNTLTAAILALFSIGGVSVIGIRISRKNIETTLKRKAIEIVLSERTARTKTKSVD